MIRRIATTLIALAFVVVTMSASARPALAAGRCSTSAGSATDRIGAFWQCVNSLSSTDYLLAEDLGQWGRNVSELDPTACISVSDFKDATAGMQTALDAASAGIPSSPPKSPDVEGRISSFWQKVGALGPGDFLAAPDLGQWAINVIDRDPSRRIRVNDFRLSTAAMQAAFDRSKAAGVSCKSVTRPTPPPGMSFVSGRATDAATGMSLKVFDVFVYPVAAGAVSSTGFYAPGGYDGNGGYFISLLPGTYRASFRLLGYTTQWWKNAPSGAAAVEPRLPR